jgi:glycosyltransferase involved in cell wall biosynthesis
MNKSILLLSAIIPEQSGAGISMRIGKHILALSNIFNVHLVVIWRHKNKHKLDVPKIFHEKCKSITFINENYYSHKESSTDKNSFLTNILSAPNSCKPIDKKTENTIKKLFSEIDPDILFLFRISMARILKSNSFYNQVKAKKIWVDFDDIESLSTYREIRVVKEKIGKIMSIYKFLDCFRIYFIERLIGNRANYIFICSEKDKTTLHKRSLNSEIIVIPNTVDTEIQLKEPAKSTPIRILFVGTMSYEPNADAVSYFVKKIYPIIKKKANVPVELFIVGFSPPEGILRLNGFNDITVTGGVEDIIPYYESSHIAIAPIRFGGGTRIKILEAMSLGRPVVSTSLGAEGIEAIDGRDLLIADTPEEFADRCLSLINSSDLRLSIKKSSQQLIKEKYSIRALEYIFKSLEEL